MPQTITESFIYPRFQQIVGASLRIDPAEVTMESSLIDLGAESLDLIEVTMESETAFNVWLPEKNILQTAREVFGEEAIEVDGRLTTFAKHILAQRIRAEDAGMLAGDVTVGDVERYFLRVGAWVTMLTHLAQHCPTACEACGGELEPMNGFRLKCKACRKDIQLRSGEELNREWLEQYGVHGLDGVSPPPDGHEICTAYPEAG